MKKNIFLLMATMTLMSIFVGCSSDFDFDSLLDNGTNPDGETDTDYENTKTWKDREGNYTGSYEQNDTTKYVALVITDITDSISGAITISDEPDGATPFKTRIIELLDSADKDSKKTTITVVDEFYVRTEITAISSTKLKLIADLDSGIVVTVTKQ